MGWNYRLIRSEDDIGVGYSVHECYYDKPGDMIPTSWTLEPASVSSETRDGLFWVISVMVEAVAQPVLAIQDGKLIEVEAKKELSDNIRAVLRHGKLVGMGEYDPVAPTETK